MRISAAICVGLAMLACSVVASGDTSAAKRLAPGDQLIYEITVELQQHHTTGGAKPHDKAAETSVQGTETFVISSIADDGAAAADVDASFAGSDKGVPFESHTASTAKITPDGRMLVKEQLGLGISDAMSFANSTATEIGQRSLSVGTTWTSPQTSPAVRLTFMRKVVGIKAYQGFSVYELQTLGSGTLVKTADGKDAKGTVAVSGTSYYDQAHRLIVGEAVRTLTVVEQPGAGNAHDDYSATMNLVLRSWTHASPAPAGQATESPQTTPTPEATAPAPAPSYYGPTPYATVTPRLGQ